MRLLDTPTYRSTGVMFGKCEYNVSEKHNQRLMEVPDAREDLRANNTQWIKMTIDECLEKDGSLRDMMATKPMTKSEYKSMIIEAVAIIKEDTTTQQMLSFGKKMEELCGIRLIQAYLHKDEGHYDVIDGSWRPNYHAHLVFSKVCRQKGIDAKGNSLYGSIIKLPLNALYTAQDYIAECTHMERGTSSDRKHLDVIRLKTVQGIANNKRLEAEIDRKTAVLESLDNKMKTLDNTMEETLSRINNTIYNILGSPLLQSDPMSRLIRTELEPSKGDISKSLHLLEKTLSLYETTLRNEESRLLDRSGNANDVFSRIGGTLGLSPSIRQMEDRNRDLEARIESYETALGAMESEITSLRSRLKNESDHCDLLRKDIKEMKTSLVGLRVKMTSIDDDTTEKLQSSGVLDIMEDVVKADMTADRTLDKEIMKSVTAMHHL